MALESLEGWQVAVVSTVLVSQRTDALFRPSLDLASAACADGRRAPPPPRVAPHHEYEMRVTAPGGRRAWTVRRRFREFVDLRASLGIPADATVFRRHGGMPTFNVPFVRTAVARVAERRPAASISIRYRDDDYDRAGAAPAVDPDLSLAQRHGASAAASFSLVAGERPSSSTEARRP